MLMGSIYSNPMVQTTAVHGIPHEALMRGCSEHNISASESWFFTCEAEEGIVGSSCP